MKRSRSGRIPNVVITEDELFQMIYILRELDPQDSRSNWNTASKSVIYKVKAIKDGSMVTVRRD